MNNPRIVPIALDGPVALCCGRLLADCDCNVQSLETGLAEVVDPASPAPDILITDCDSDD